MQGNVQIICRLPQMWKYYEHNMKSMWTSCADTGGGFFVPAPSVFIVVSHLFNVLFIWCSHCWQPAYYLHMSLHIIFTLISYVFHIGICFAFLDNSRGLGRYNPRVYPQRQQYSKYENHIKNTYDNNMQGHMKIVCRQPKMWKSY